MTPTGRSLRREPVVRPARGFATHSGPAEPAPCFVSNEAPDIAPIEHSEAERAHREFPAAYALYASDIYSGVYALGQAALNLNLAMLKRDASACQTLAEFCAAESARINSVSEILAKRMAELRRRSPLTRV